MISSECEEVFENVANNAIAARICTRMKVTVFNQLEIVSVTDAIEYQN